MDKERQTKENSAEMESYSDIADGNSPSPIFYYEGAKYEYFFTTPHTWTKEDYESQIDEGVLIVGEYMGEFIGCGNRMPSEELTINQFAEGRKLDAYHCSYIDNEAILLIDQIEEQYLVIQKASPIR